MSDKKGGVIINNELTDPLGDFVIDYLLSQTKETSYHDFKTTFNISKNSNDFPKIMKDVYGFCEQPLILTVLPLLCHTLQ